MFGHAVVGVAGIHFTFKSRSKGVWNGGDGKYLLVWIFVASLLYLLAGCIQWYLMGTIIYPVGPSCITIWEGLLFIVHGTLQFLGGLLVAVAMIWVVVVPIIRTASLFVYESL
jgi:hypothetical protein